MGQHCFSMYLLTGFTVKQGLSNLLHAFSALGPIALVVWEHLDCIANHLRKQYHAYPEYLDTETPTKLILKK